jgi:hypothetical protein
MYQSVRPRGFKESEKSHTKKKISKRGWILFVSFFVAVVIGFVWLMNRPGFMIHTVDIRGYETLFEEDLRKSIDKYLDQDIFHVIPRKNVLFFRASHLREHLAQDFPRIKTLVVDVDQKVISIDIGERKVHMLWCVHGTQDLFVDEECYFGDETGFIYDRSPYFSERAFTKIYIDPEWVELSSGMSIFDYSDYIDFVYFLEKLELINDIGIHSIVLDRIDMVVSTYRVHDFEYSDNFLVSILFSREHSYETSLRNLGLVLKHTSFMVPFNQAPQDLESIDVRFDGRVYPRFRNEKRRAGHESARDVNDANANTETESDTSREQETSLSAEQE